MRGRPVILLFLLVSLLSRGCEFRPLTEPGNVSYVRIYLDEHLLNVTEGFYNPAHVRPRWRTPEIFRVALFDASGAMVSERYLRSHGEDSLGRYVDGFVVAEAGTYSLLAYNLGTESTLLRDEYSWWDAAASTNEVSRSLRESFVSRAGGPSGNESIRYDADHLLVVSETGVAVRPRSEVDTLVCPSTGRPWFTASSVVKSYYLEVGVRGARWLSSSSVLLTGMSGEVALAGRAWEDAPEVTLHFPTVADGGEGEDGGRACIYGTFGTFGKLPDRDNVLTVSFELVTSYGTRLEETFPITEVFFTEDALLRQWLIIDRVIEVPDPPDRPPGEGPGGLNPHVGEWGNIENDVEV